MGLRRLQRLNEADVWFDDGYVVENSEGDVVFRYSVAWDRVGAACEVKMREAGTALEEVEMVIPVGDELRWLPVEVVADEEAEAFLEALDETCGIPKPRPISVGRRKVA